MIGVRLQTPKLLAYALLTCIVAGRSFQETMLLLATVLVLSIGIYSLDDYVDLEADKILHPHRAAVVARNPRLVLLLSMAFLALALGLASLDALTFRRLESLIACAGIIVVALPAIYAFKLAREPIAQNLVKSVFTGAALFLLTLMCASLSRPDILAVGALIWAVHVGNVYVSDLLDAHADAKLGYKPSENLRALVAAVYAAAMIVVLAAQLYVWPLSALPATLMIEASLAMLLYVILASKVSKKLVYAAASLGGTGIIIVLAAIWLQALS